MSTESLKVKLNDEIARFGYTEKAWKLIEEIEANENTLAKLRDAPCQLCGVQKHRGISRVYA